MLVVAHDVHASGRRKRGKSGFRSADKTEIPLTVVVAIQQVVSPDATEYL